MWTPTTRRRHSRAGLRYETDLGDAEWAVIASRRAHGGEEAGDLRIELLGLA
jgi:hypothetical protein